MSEPTKEAIEEAAVFAETFQITHRNWEAIDDKQLAKIIAIIRTQAINDALERAALYFENMGPAYEMFCDSIADEIRAMKVPT